MKKHSISIIAAFGILITISIQSIWLYHSFLFVKDDYVTKMSNMLEQAVNEEMWNRMHRVPEGNYVVGRQIEDMGSNLPEFAYVQESLEALNLPISIDTVNMYLINILEENAFPTETKLTICKGDTLLQEVGETDGSPFNIHSNPVPLRKDYSIVIKGELTSPGRLFYDRMGGLLISTVFLMVFVAICIVLELQTIRKEKRFSKARQQFYYFMVHDMKSPLTSILMTLKFLHTGQLDKKPETKEQFCRIAMNEADNLLTLTNKVLTIAKLENNRFDINKTQVELAPMMEKMMQKYTAAAQKTVTFHTHLKAEMVYADAGYLQEMISNLIDNSIKYSGEAVKIDIASEEEEKYIVVKVRDNGFGISMKDQRIIFNKFERGEAAGKRKNGATGFGLGLNFVNQVAEAHGGRVELRSIEGEFTEFSVYFPKQETIENNL